MNEGGIKTLYFLLTKGMIDHVDDCTKNEPISVTLKDDPGETSSLPSATGPFQ